MVGSFHYYWCTATKNHCQFLNRLSDSYQNLTWFYCILYYYSNAHLRITKENFPQPHILRRLVGPFETLQAALLPQLAPLNFLPIAVLHQHQCTYMNRKITREVIIITAFLLIFRLSRPQSFTRQDKLHLATFGLLVCTSILAILRKPGFSLVGTLYLFCSYKTLIRYRKRKRASKIVDVLILALTLYAGIIFLAD